MGLRLKEGWTEYASATEGDHGAVMYVKMGRAMNSGQAHVIDFSNTDVPGYGFYTRPHGAHNDTKNCWTAEEAHAYLIAQGSDSPWQEVPTDAELTAAAEDEGPSIDDDAESCRRHRANLHRIQVVDDSAVNRCRCAWVVTEPPAPRLCAVDRLEAAGYVMHTDAGQLVFTREGSGPRVWVGLHSSAVHRAKAGGDGLSKLGDPLPGLNAALESLLSKPVGAVTVAQILGVAP